MVLVGWGKVMPDDLDQEPEEEIIEEQINCAGIPYCDLPAKKIIKAQKDGCVWCTRLFIHADGRTEVVQPGEA